MFRYFSSSFLQDTRNPFLSPFFEKIFDSCKKFGEREVTSASIGDHPIGLDKHTVKKKDHSFVKICGELQELGINKNIPAYTQFL